MNLNNDSLSVMMDLSDFIMKKSTVNMTCGSPARHILNFTFPLILTNMGQQLYMIVDGAIVGRGVGVNALAAVGATDWCYWSILWTVGGLAQGFSTFVSRAFGERNYFEMNKTISAAMELCLFIGFFFTVVGIAAAKSVLEILNTPADILSGASDYLMMMISGTLIVMGYNLTSAILRGLGDGQSPLVAMIIAGLLNIGLDCLFVFGFNWGIIGAALASLLAQLVSFLYCLFAIARIELVSFNKQYWHFDFGKIKTMLLFGIPISFQYVVIAMGGMILQSSINLQGSVFIAGYTATNKLYGFLQCFAMSVGQASCTFVSQNYGAGLGQRVRQGVADSVKIVMAMAILIMVITLFTRSQLLRVFLDVSIPDGIQALDVSVRYLTIMILSFPILHILHVFRNVLQALGIAIWSLMSGFAELAARILMSKFVIGYIGVDALFLSEPASWLGAMLCVFLPYFYYRKKLLR